MPKYLSSAGKMTLSGQRLAEELYEPAVSTMLSWFKDGEAAAYSRYGELSQVVLNTAQTDRYLREDIAIETFVRALVPFLRRLDNGEYDPSRGATVESFFIGACRNRIGDVIRSHHARIIELRADTSELLQQAKGTGTAVAENYVASPDDTVVGLALARELLLEAPRNLRSVLLLVIYEGVTLTEAAKRVGVKPATIRSQLSRYKKRIAWLHFRGIIDIPTGTGLGDWTRTTLEQRRLAAEARNSQTVA